MKFNEMRSGSIYMREPLHMLETGHIVEGHAHNFDHTTFFFAGLWKVTCFAEDGAVAREANVRGGTPGAHLLIEASKKHRLELLEGPGSYACVYSHRTQDGEIVTEYTGWRGAYL